MIVCAGWHEHNDAPNQWSHVLTSFGVTPDNFFWWGAPEDLTRRDSYYIQKVDSLGELPSGNLVVFAAPESRYVKGDILLQNWTPDDNDILVFGSDHRNIEESDFGGRPHRAVYIHTATHHELYSFVAGAIALHYCMWGADG